MANEDMKQIIFSNLNEWIELKDIHSFSSQGSWKCTFRLRQSLIEIQYDIIDNFYRVRIEHASDYIFLTKSKNYKNAVKKVIKDSKLKWKSFESHVIALTTLLKNYLRQKEDLMDIGAEYQSDLSFDGIFL